MTTPGPPPTTTATKDDPDARTGVLASAVRVVSGLTLVSRFAGLARDVVTARLFGDGALGSAFRAAYTLPNVFRRLFGEGALSAAFLPEYVLLNRDDPASAAALASIVNRVLLLMTGALTLLGIGALLVLLAVLPPDQDRSLSFKLMILMLPMMPAVCLTAVLGGMLQAHGRFGPPAAAPIVLNVFQIAAGLVCYAGWLSDRTLGAYLVGSAAVAASAVQIAWSLWALRGRVRWGAAAGAGRDHARRVLARFIPAMLGLGTLQLNTMLDQVIAMWPLWVGPTILGHAFPLDEKSNAILSYTQTVYQFPLGVFGIAVATAVFPMLSRVSDRPEEFARTLRRGLRLSFFIGLPATVGMIHVRHDLVAVLFGSAGSKQDFGFTPEGLARSADSLLGFSLGIFAYSLNHVLTRAFYARHDTKTPMKVAIGAVVLNLVLNWTLIWYFREAGMAWATGIAAIAQLMALSWLTRRLLNVNPLDRETAWSFVQMWIVTGIMGAMLAIVKRNLDPADGWSGHLVRLMVLVGLGVACFGLLAWLLKVPELRWLLQRAPAGTEGQSPGVPME